MYIVYVHNTDFYMKYFHALRKSLGCCESRQPVYQAIWANNNAFDEVLVSPSMINDHMPDYVLEALEKVEEISNITV